jgi:8-oxo-dGTP diphosphatase
MPFTAGAGSVSHREPIDPGGCALAGPSPASVVIDTHVFLRDGDKILLSQRGGTYGYGRWHAPSGKLESGETVRAGAARELLEETGVEVDPDDLRLVHVVHHKQSVDVERIGFFFEATRWQGEPVNREADKCLALEWFSVHDLPADIIEYPAAGLTGYLGNTPALLTEHGWTSAED